jgi:hypothetical protein
MSPSRRTSWPYLRTQTKIGALHRLRNIWLYILLFSIVIPSVLGPDIYHITLLSHLLGITKLGKEKNQCIREKTGAQNVVKGIKQYQKYWLQHVQRV